VNQPLLAALAQLLIDHPTWQRTNTPPEILARHMIRAAEDFEATLLARAAHFNKPTGIEAYPYEYPQDHTPSR
jgi:hypothetical protein